MPREKIGFREQYEIAMGRIEELFPNSLGMLTTEQVAVYLNCNKKTVLNLIAKRSNPLPAKNIGVGRTIYRIPAAQLIRWSLGDD